MTAKLRLPVIPRDIPALSPSPAPLDALTRRGLTYLRVVANAICPLSCSFCHREGDPAQQGLERGLSTEQLTTLLLGAVDAGVAKLKLVGGEPLLRGDLPEVLAGVRIASSSVDLSVITSGAVPRARIDAAFEAGLSRCNVSIHGFGEAAFAARTGRGALHGLRQRFLDAVLEHGRPIKLNYVYTGAQDLDDLASLLGWAASRPVVVNVLDDLGNDGLDDRSLLDVIERLCGSPALVRREHDAHSLSTARLLFDDGLEVEIKDGHLGEVAPYRACVQCPARASCREGIKALRLSHTGELRPCMGRPDLGVSLLGALGSGRQGVAGAIRAHVEEVAK